MINKMLRLTLVSVCLVAIGCGTREPASEYSDISAGAAWDAAVASQDGAAPFAADLPEASFNTESYDDIVENPFLAAKSNPLSTFSIDVDTAAYANVRRFLNQRQRPPAGAVRIEELLNYFNYDYPQPLGENPFSVNVEVASCPWSPQHQLVRIGLKGREIESGQRPASNLVFLLDVSGSMQSRNKLPLVKSALRLLIEQLDENDRVAIVVYAGSSGLVLPSTTADQKHFILSSLDSLEAGGSTNGAEGIRLAYQVAQQDFIPGGTNRVILCTDGDFNVGITNHSDLVDLIESRARTGIFLSALGFGMGNYKDSTIERLADKGNGHYSYIDSLHEARKVLVQQMSGTLITIAKDVKVQVDFNAAQVSSYRLLGYENRLLRAEDFRDDSQDAGEIGAGHTVTALYQIEPAGVETAAAVVRSVEPSKYQQPTEFSAAAATEELLTVRLSYKDPDGENSREFRHAVPSTRQTFEQASQDFRFAAAVAAFGMLLRESKYRGDSTFPTVISMAEQCLETDPLGYRREFVQLARIAAQIVDQEL